ncbi:MAG: uroporphyrinogen-III C-methyltransferase [Rhodobacterales bacterium]|nr:MAG: uroporphyrinogen-III C-methyltransferase [Rhodobacterales bacterium]
MTTHPPFGPDFRWPDFNWPEFLPGWVWLVGAGPGDPGLLTLHAVNALRHAETIIHDGLVAPAILDWANPEAERIAMAKRGGQVSPTQAEISALLVERARAGRRVLRLKGGDPFVFGRGGEEGQVLARAGIPFRLVPGITAGIGGLGYAGIPVTHGRVNAAVTFVTGHDINGHAPPLDWAAIARASPVIVLYMGMRTLGEIADKLIAAGRGPEEPVALVQNASTPEQKVLETSLARAAAEAEAAGFGAPVITCIGRTALLRQALDWQGQAAGDALRNPDPLT